MRGHIFHITLIFVFFILFSPFVYATPPASLSCDGSALRACVGSCGNPFVGVHVVNANDLALSTKKNRANFCLEVDLAASNLCPSEEIGYRLSVNGHVRASGEIGYSFGSRRPADLITVAAKEGDLVTVEISHFLDNPNIYCIVLGEAYLDLGYVKK